MLVLASCSLPSESEAMGRLTATETVVDEIVAAALGADVVTEWERERDEMSLTCQGDRSSVFSTLKLAGSYPEEVLDRLAAEATAAGAKPQPITHYGFEDASRGAEFWFSWDRPDLVRGVVNWNARTSMVLVRIYSGCFRT